MKKRGLICLLLCVSLLLSVPAQAADSNTAETIPSGEEVSFSNTTGSCSTMDADRCFLTKIEDIDNAEALFLYETTTDTVMYTYNADTPMYPSSLTKIMTALLVLENSNLADKITVKQEILNEIPAGAAIAKLKADEVLTVEMLLYSMMVDSANDSTAVLADFVAGSQEAFVQMMNARAAEIGCTNTNFVNVHGLYEDGHVSTARDIARILNVAIENEIFVEIFGTVGYTIPATNKSDERYISTGNYLMTKIDPQVYYDSRVTGGRTGVTPSGLRCIAATAEYEDMQMISVVMGAESVTENNSTAIKRFGSFDETSALLDHGFNEMCVTQILYPGQVLKKYTVANGNSDLAVGSNISLMSVLPKTVTSSQLTYQYTDVSKDISAPIEKGEKISSVEVFYNGIRIAAADLYAMHSVEVKQNAPTNPIISKDGSTVQILLVVIGVMAVIIIFLFGSRYIHKVRLEARRKRVRNKHRRRN